MAATTDLSARVDLDLRIVRRALDALRRVEGAWAEVDRAPRQSADEIAADRLGYRDEWCDVMVRFDQLRQIARIGRLSDRQAESYRELLRLAGADLPTVQRLGLDLPSEAVIREIEAIRHIVTRASG